MDADGYPEDDELQAIAGWTHTDIRGLLDFVKARWNWAESHWRESDETFDGALRVQAITGGWSGNESLIQALADNATFWAACWWSSDRGGQHVFRVPLRLLRAEGAER